VSFNSSGVGSGTITITNSHNFTIEGYVNTSHGRVATTVDEAVNFSNVTYVALTASNEEIQNEVQSSTVDAKTTTRDGFLFDTRETHFSYPFTINLSDAFLSNGDVPQLPRSTSNLRRRARYSGRIFPRVFSRARGMK